MDTEMESTPTLFDPENLSAREKYRRYRKRQSSSNVSPFLGSSSSKFTETSLLFDGNSNGIQRPPNAALLLEEIKQEVDSHEFDDIEASTYKAPDSNRRRVSADRHGTPGLSVGLEPSTMALKQEDDVLMDVGESSFSLFSSLLDSALQGLIPFADLILHFEKTCRSISESIRFGGIMRHRIVEDKLMRRKAQLLLDEAASWSLIWHLFGKGNDDLPENLILTPPTSHQEACQFVVSDITAQLCLRIVLWLEGLASEALDLDKKVKGSHVGTYLPSSGVWHHTQRYLKKKNDDPSIIKHLDFDAATREASQEIYDDRKQDESLLEDIWILLRAGRVEEACELCRSAGQKPYDGHQFKKRRKLNGWPLPFLLLSGISMVAAVEATSLCPEEEWLFQPFAGAEEVGGHGRWRDVQLEMERHAYSHPLVIAFLPMPIKGDQCGLKRSNLSTKTSSPKIMGFLCAISVFLSPCCYPSFL